MSMTIVVNDNSPQIECWNRLDGLENETQQQFIRRVLAMQEYRDVKENTLRTGWIAEWRGKK